MFSGKWVWIWNWRRCLGGNAVAVARRLRDAGCAGAIVKSDDGGHPFDQGRPVTEIVHALQSEGLFAGCWGYVYGCDVPTEVYGDLKRTAIEEAAEAVRVITERPDPSYRGPDVYVIDVESEYERFPSDPAATARRYLETVRAAVGPDHPLLYAPLPQPDFHRRLPYAVFNRYCDAVLPQAYHNAMQVEPDRAVDLCYRAFRSEQLDTLPLAPVGGAYGDVTADDLVRWARAAIDRGARALSWWSFEHIENDCPELWDAIGRVHVPEEDIEMDEEARRIARETAFRQRIAGLILSGDPALADQAYRELTYVRALANECRHPLGPAPSTPSAPRAFSLDSASSLL